MILAVMCGGTVVIVLCWAAIAYLERGLESPSRHLKNQ